uniref:Uncharacterized protein n=1 Tax=Anguilla anguilla TaxID=7936 RepID=A0A0E9P9Q1_ANGAN
MSLCFIIYEFMILMDLAPWHPRRNSNVDNGQQEHLMLLVFMFC